MKVTIISVGKIKEKYIAQGIEKYVKQLSSYVSVEIIEVADEKAPETLSEAEKEMVKIKEGERILKYVDSDMYVFTLEIEGKILTSEQFATNLKKLKMNGRQSVAFIIGGSLGLSKEVLSRSNFALSFSKMTFPHQLMRVILLEQLYRTLQMTRWDL